MAKGYFTGIPDRVEIDPRMCEKGEKFLGGYHTHFRQDSYPSAEDLHYCGLFKIICSGGNDNKIRCNTFKDGQQSVEDYNKMVYDIDKGETKYENPKYQPNFDCIRTMGPLFSEEKRIKEEVDIDLDEKISRLYDLRRRGVSEHAIIEAENRLANDTEKRNRSVRKLVKKIRDESKKYYNEVEII